MLLSVLKYLRNYFVKDILSGSYSIVNGTLTIPNASAGQYIMIKGSILNDGVYKYPTSGLTEEQFTGEVWLLAIPKEIIDLSAKIEEYEKNNIKGGFSSESFGGYSYSRATGKNGKPITWQEVFYDELKIYKKVM